MTRTALFVGMVCGVTGFAIGLNKRAPYRGCSSLVPIVVASVDMRAGTTVTFDHLSQRSVPEQFVTKSVVKPDSASYVVGQVIDHDVEAGDPLRWDDFPLAMSRALHDGERALRLELDEALIKGDRVDVWSNGLLVAENAEVLTSGGTRRWVKVSTAEAELVVRSGGPLTAVLRPR